MSTLPTMETTGQERVLIALARLENIINTMEETVFGPQGVAYPPEASRETVGIAKAMNQFLDRMEAGLDVAYHNLTGIQVALSKLPNQGYKELAK